MPVHNLTPGSRSGELRSTLDWQRVKKFSAIRSGAKARGITFTLTYDKVLFPSHCPVLGIRLNYGNKVRDNRDNSPSFDKIIPEFGYIPGNVQVISYRANRIKNSATPKQLKMVYRFWRDFDHWCDSLNFTNLWPKYIVSRQRQKLRNLKSRCKYEGKEFDIQFGDVQLPNTCPVLDIALDYELPIRGDNSPSFERIRPDKGYVGWNTIIVSELANRIRQNASVEELGKVYRHTRFMVKRCLKVQNAIKCTSA